MELRQLTYFLAAAQTQNFRKAADLCLVAQPALSRQIATLEDELGVELFKRIKQRVALTPAGEAFANHVQRALDTLQHGQQEMVRWQEGHSGTVLVGCNHSLAGAFLPPLLSIFQQQYPDIQVKVSVHSSDKVLTLVEYGEVDLGFIFDPQIRSKVLVVKELYREPIQLLVSPQHPLAHLEASELTLARIVKEPLITLGETARLRKVLERIITQRGLGIRSAIEMESIEGLRSLVRESGGATLVPPSLLCSSKEDNQLVLRPIIDLPEEFIFALIYRRFGSMSPSARQFIKTAIQVKNQRADC
jgi:DNA-binding transcriptional LysR family regulator